MGMVEIFQREQRIRLETAERGVEGAIADPSMSVSTGSASIRNSLSSAAVSVILKIEVARSA